MAIISIITACFNHGIYLDEAFESIQLDKYKDIFEHIIVNDGSNDNFTLQKLKELEQKGVQVIHQQNSGLAKARNAGIAIARGKYILPLDSDNKIIPDVFLKAARLMDVNENVAVIHTQAILFGADKGLWEHLAPFNLQRMFVENHIDACALIRKSVLDKVGGYSEDVPVMGHEDWELWIKIGLLKNEFIFLEIPGFYYRVVEQSMTKTISNPNIQLTLAYIFHKHFETVSELYPDLYYSYQNSIKRCEYFAEYVHRNRFRSILKLLLGKKIMW